MTRSLRATDNWGPESISTQSMNIAGLGIATVAVLITGLLTISATATAITNAATTLVSGSITMMYYKNIISQYDRKQVNYMRSLSKTAYIITILLNILFLCMAIYGILNYHDRFNNFVYIVLSSLSVERIVKETRLYIESKNNK